MWIYVVFEANIEKKSYADVLQNFTLHGEFFFIENFQT